MKSLNYTRLVMAVCVILASLIALGAALNSAEASKNKGVRTSMTLPKIFVVGDSITAQGECDRGERQDAWVCMLAREKPAQVERDGRGGTGILRSNAHPNFADPIRIDLIRDYKPDYLLVVGGRNDWDYSRIEILMGVDSYLSELKELAQEIGIKKIYLATVWGPKNQDDKARVVEAYGKQAEKHGIKYRLFDLAPEHTLDDGVHPNEYGRRWLADRFKAMVIIP